MKSILIIAGVDSSGGAGLICDAVTAHALGVHPKAVVTAVTAQGAKGVTHIAPMTPDAVAAQITAAGQVDAIKIGMIPDLAVLETIIARLPDAPTVCDPVIAASSGKLLTSPDVIANYPRLFARCALVTPNRPEADVLGKINAPTLLKGGHADGAESTDILFDGRRQSAFRTPRLPVEKRGTGCKLSTAIACYLAMGDTLDHAITRAKAHVTAYLQA